MQQNTQSMSARSTDGNLTRNAQRAHSRELRRNTRRDRRSYNTDLRRVISVGDYDLWLEC